MSKKHSKKKLIKTILFIFIIIGALLSWKAYNVIYSPNITLKNGDESYNFNLPSNSTVEEIIKKLDSEIIFKNKSDFEILANYLDLKDYIYPGLYKITTGMTNKDLYVLFRSAKRAEVKVRIGFQRYARDVVKAIAPKIEASEEDLLTLLNDKAYRNSLGFNRNNIICLFLPDTYFFKWNTNANDFYTRMLEEYINFWNKDRLDKAESIGLSALEVMTLASIVDQETNKNDEKSRIAGVYLNRKRIGMPLQADPTVKYALGDFSIKRIYSKHTKGTTSKYNTYMYTGLPPGPICTPSKAGIDAVLNAEKHDFLYFCAKPGYSGYHQFAKNFSAHRANAKIYQRWLTSEGY